ncbi:MAG: hypothetical protein CMK95_06305 [Pseudomonas sp.]|uniref:hypothetical protein n=1 Tax=Stutzerimonas stutzeri TaxID=316 RepID=UPI000C61B0EE|nr:hypothetical protein [Stutzerimonas stutzeri]MAL35637.1 hypothetical protein [Pseudomonas sp.]MBK3794685.1 hypothetical protein [Stutzerimonas stutzeri]MBK3878962.1 hypothetical protein [Stutzerimonas stutzeri]HAO73431.1 hypothetical protein [Pseudomonas sp.]HBM09286.1 hypothetical protein [Pseudomonas sp.]
MNIDIKHKHAGHLIVIEGHPFKANNAGQWDLTDIWQALKLPKGKAPGRWRGKDKERLLQSQNLDVQNLGKTGHRILATKRATLEYAGWVSDDFKDMVFDAFEAVLERAEVAQAVAQVMNDLGHSHSAAIVKRMVFNDKCDWKKAPHRNSVKGLKAAIRNGHLTPEGAHVIARRDGLRVSLAALELVAI